MLICSISSFIGCAVQGFTSKISALCVSQTWLNGFGQIFCLNEFNIVKYDIKRLRINLFLGRVYDDRVVLMPSKN